MRFEVECKGKLDLGDGSVPPRHLFQQYVDRLADELTTLSVQDPFVGSDSGTGMLDIVVSVEADDELGGIERAVVAIRTASHAAGVATPGWEGIRWHVVARTGDLIEA